MLATPAEDVDSKFPWFLTVDALDVDFVPWPLAEPVTEIGSLDVLDVSDVDFGFGTPAPPTTPDVDSGSGLLATLEEERNFLVNVVPVR